MTNRNPDNVVLITGAARRIGRALALDTATVSTLGWERENRVVREWNEACHLRSMDPVL